MSKLQTLRRFRPPLAFGSADIFQDRQKESANRCLHFRHVTLQTYGAEMSLRCMVQGPRGHLLVFAQ